MMMKRPNSWMAAIMVGLVQIASVCAEDGKAIAWWNFDALEKQGFVEQSSGARDAAVGNSRVVAGVKGFAFKGDGFATGVVRKAEAAPRLGDAFTFQAWVAVQAYPLGWCPLIAQREAKAAGYFFGLDARGRLGLHAAVGGKWVECISQQSVPLMKWSHVSATFDSGSGVRLYIDGEPAGELNVTGALTYAEKADVHIGRNRDRETVMFSAAWGSADQAMHFAFDGLIDELQVHGRCLAPEAIREAFTASQPSTPPALTPRRLPSGPAEPLRFGAFNEHLRYCEEWDAIWRGSGPDVVVGFDFAPVRLVFWRGTSYVPCWVTEKGNWLTNEFMERGSDRKSRGCSEPMSDKRAHYSHVKILENSDARAVVYWRYSPVGVDYSQAFVDETTGWGDWAEEYHTIYPDGVAVRKVVMYSSDLKPWHEWCQTIQVLHPGQRPEDVLDPERIVAIANMKGESRTYGWEAEKSYRHPTLEGANIQITYLKSKYNPFLVLDDRDSKNDRGGTGPAITRTGGIGWSEHSMYPWWNHWPVIQVPILERQAQAADLASHTCTSTQYSAAYETGPNHITKIMLCGMTDKPIDELLPLAKSWLRPPELTVDSQTYESLGYDPAERVYRLACRQAGKPEPVRLRFDAGAESPVVNLAILVRDWGEQKMNVSVRGAAGGKETSARVGHHRRMSGTDAVVWIDVQATSPLEVVLTPR